MAPSSMINPIEMCTTVLVDTFLPKTTRSELRYAANQTADVRIKNARCQLSVSMFVRSTPWISMMIVKTRRMKLIPPQTEMNQIMRRRSNSSVSCVKDRRNSVVSNDAVVTKCLLQKYDRSAVFCIPIMLGTVPLSGYRLMRILHAYFRHL